ncbi:hypothetical protein D7W79_32565 [Corallococcus exercitus]|uniref:hypothetical protein n=1 Tax=Corallococcus exercitus TaxID=2316736 RepID=UPI000EA227D3|nr:hypothetical protein [Corallococcus exercitus]RKG69800.1 hypothetical protein D7W79_32565 [Corallococcus exercitus]
MLFDLFRSKKTPRLPKHQIPGPVRAGVIRIDLLYPEPPALDVGAFSSRLAEIMEKSRIADGQDAGGALLIEHTDLPLQYEDRTEPAMSVVAQGPVTDMKPISVAFAQSPKWEGLEQVRTATHAISVMELMTVTLHPANRLMMLSAVAAVLCTLHRPLAVHWVNSERLVEPDLFVDVVAEGDVENIIIAGAVHCQLHRKQEPWVMDTLGLDALGLNDIQCKFKDVDPGRVAQVLALLASAQIVTGGDAREYEKKARKLGMSFDPVPSQFGPPRSVFELNIAG